MSLLKDYKGVSEASSAPINLLDWYDLDQEIILVMERPVPCEDLFQHVIDRRSTISEQEANVRIND